MKATSSSRSLTNGASTHSARSTMASPLAATASNARMSEAGKKSRRGSLDRDANFHTVGSSPDLMLQLQQFQHQQQLHQQTMAASMAYGYPTTTTLPPMPTTYVSYIPQPPPVLPSMPVGVVQSTDMSTRSYQSVDGEDLMGRIDKKDHMIAQLGSFLTQMKQESEGTAHAWKEKMQELAGLKRQVAALTQQLTESQAKEKQTAEQLAQVTEDVELAVQGLKESDVKHHEELKIMNDEIQRQQAEEEKTRVETEEMVRKLKEQLEESMHQLEEQTQQRHSLEDALEKMDGKHQFMREQMEKEQRDWSQQLEQTHTQLQSLEKEKQELTQLLWNVTQALEQATHREQSLHVQLDETSKAMDQHRTDWTERMHELQREKGELVTTCTTLQSQLQALQTQVQEERYQKEQINALMGNEMQRIGVEIQGLHQQYTAKLEQNQVEIDHWKNEATTLQEKVVRADGQYVVTRKQLDEWQARASQIDEEFQRLQQTGTEKAYTLQEINEQLRQSLSELHDSRQRSEQLRIRCEALENGVAQCLHHLPDDLMDGENAVEGFPTNLLNVLDEWKKQSSHMEQIKVSMLRLQQDRDHEREKFRTREQELVQKGLQVQLELDTAKADALALAQELQGMTQRVSSNEATVASQLQQLTKELEESRTTSALQVLQLQKALESQKLRGQQLETEKRDLLQESEGMNATVQSLYQAKNEKQVELDQLKASWKELQAEHADLKETLEDLETNYERTTNELNQKAKELQQVVQTLMVSKEQLEKDDTAVNEAFGKLKSEFETLHRQYTAEQTKSGDQERELRQVLDEKSHRLEEMMEMLTQVRAKNEILEQARATDDHNVRAEYDKFQQQLLALSQDKKRIEMAYTTTKTQLDQLMPELFTLKEEKRHYTQAHSDFEDEISNLRSEMNRLQGELERSSRMKSSLQLELNRVTDEGQDVVRQFEVLRRDSKTMEKQYQDEIERLRKEVDDVRNESSESAAMVEELQTKMTSVQNAANATINELMNELQTVQDTMRFDKTKFQKENELLKTQVRTIEDELRKKDSDVKDIQVAFRQEQDHFTEKENELKTKLTRVTSALETKKQEVDRLSKEVEAKGLKVAEYERKLNPLINTRDSLQAKCNELKIALEAKIRETHDVEERYRDETARAIKDKRDIETMYLSMKEDYELMKSQTTGQHQQWQSDVRTMKHTVERTKADLMKANAEVLSLTQRLESSQQNAQDTIADLATRLQGADQQKELAVNALQREINLERERRREAEVQKMELQRLLRQRNPSQSFSSSTSGVVVTSGYAEDTGSWGLTMPTPASQRQPPVLNQEPLAPVRSTSAPEVASQSYTEPSKPAEYRKFYANEPMTNAELANLPMNLIKAQIGLDLAASASKSPTKTVKPGPQSTAKLSVGDNNDDIPMLSFDKLPQNPEAHDGESSPTYDSNNSTRLVSEKRSGAVSLLEALSARSSSDRYLIDAIESSTRPQRNASGSFSGASSSNNKKKPNSTKKKRPSVLPSSSAAATAAYAAPSLSPPKMKSNSKLLPRIQQ